MRLDQLLVQKKMCESRMEAQELIASGFVFVDGQCITKQTRQFDESVVIEVTSRRKFVSRGGDKLEGVLLDIYKEESVCKEVLQDKIALDVGSSTGGFTDCLLQYGVRSVDAVDVGTKQLHKKLLEDSRVSLHENTDIRSFTPNKTYQIIVGDVSFIPLEKILDTVLSFGEEGTLLFLLIKPQFEVGKGNTKKGIVKDRMLVDSVLDQYSHVFKEKGVKEGKIYLSKVVGGDGNQEYFFTGKC